MLHLILTVLIYLTTTEVQAKGCTVRAMRFDSTTLGTLEACGAVTTPAPKSPVRAM